MVFWALFRSCLNPVSYTHLSSLSGNTKKIAEAIAEVAEDSELISVKEFQPSMLAHFDLFYIGYWVDKGDCDAAALRVLDLLKEQQIVLFGTLGAAEQTDYYDMVKKRVEAHAANNHILGHFLCQGAVGEAVIARYRSMLAEHPEDEHRKQQLANYENGKSHPDEQDLANARAFAQTIG